MSEVEELANKYFEEQCEHTYADTIEELKEDVVTAFLQGYAKGETDEKFRTKQVVTKDMAELKAQIEKMKCCENCKHSNTTCECYTICTIGHYDDCKSNTVLDSLDKKDYWEN